MECSQGELKKKYSCFISKKPEKLNENCNVI